MSRIRPIVERHALTAGVAVAIFALALESGGYEVTTRNCFAIALWWTIGVGIAAGLWPNERIPQAALIGGAALAALLTMTGLWVLWADSAEKAFTEFNRVAFYLGVFALVVIAARRSSAGRWADGIAIGIAAVGVLALVSRLFPDLIDDRGVSSAFPGGIRYLGYPLDYWNGLGIFLGLGLPLMLRTAAEARSGATRALAIAPFPAVLAAMYLTSSRGGFVTAAIATLVFLGLGAERLRLLVTTAFAAAGGVAAILVVEARSDLADGILNSDVIDSQGRSAAVLIAVICVVTAVVYLFASRVRIPSPRFRVPRVAVAVALIALVGAAVVVANPADKLESFKEEPANPFAVETAAGGSTGSASSHLFSSGGNGRWQFWGAAVDEFETRPLVGRGPGSYEEWWAQHGSISYFTRHAHSHYLQTLGELGVIGVLLLLAFLLSPLPSLRARLRAGTARDRNAVAALAAVFAGFLFGLAVDWIWELPVVTVVAVAAIALLLGPATLGGAEAPGSGPGAGRRARLVARVVGVLVALGLIAAQAIPLVAQDRIEASQDKFAAADLDGARDAALDARDVQPWAASPHLQLALVEEASGNLDAAGDEIDDAIENDPLDWRLWLTAARIDATAGDDASAEERLDRAVELNPRSPLFADR
jgi:O-antigen ligase